IDNAAPFDVEVIDEWMFICSATPFDAASPATYERMFRIVDTVGAKTVTQTDRYADERVGNYAADIVAPQGARLKRGVSVGAIIIVAIAAIIWGVSFIGDVILRTRPLPPVSQWFSTSCTDPSSVFTRLYRPASVLWNGSSVWALLEGHALDVAEQAAAVGLLECSGPPALPVGSRRSVAPAVVTSLTGEFVAELGVGVVHHAEASTTPPRSERVIALAKAMKDEFDPTGRLNPGIDV
ncbi:MAG: FAD-linked oxidase C-terminal domain-containing protein, partial [Actinomycetota bacterium]